MRLFEYAVILEEKLNKDGEVVEEAEIVTEPTTVLADDQEQASLLAGRSIPEEYMAKIKRLTVVVRPF